MEKRAKRGGRIGSSRFRLVLPSYEGTSAPRLTGKRRLPHPANLLEAETENANRRRVTGKIAKSVSYSVFFWFLLSPAKQLQQRQPDFKGQKEKYMTHPSANVNV